MTIRDLPRFVLPIGGLEEKYANIYSKDTLSKVPRVSVSYSRKRLYLAALVGNLLYLSTGSVIAWPSPTVPILTKTSGLTADQASWLGSLYALGAVAGPALTALCLDSIGRKATLIVTAVVFLISWIIIGSSTWITLIYVGRIIGGIAVGASFAGVSNYIAEISDNEVRGAIGSINQMFVGMGLTVQYAVGPYVSYQALVGVSASVAVLFLVCILGVPDSPYYLMSIGRKDKAVKALCWLRGNVRPPLVQREITNIEETLEESRTSAGKRSDLFFKKGPRRALLISLWAMLCQQISGVNIVLCFAQTIFQMASQSFPPQYSSILIGAVNIVASGFAPPLVKRFGIKFVLIATSFLMGVCQLVLSLYFYLKSRGTDVSNLDWLPIGSLLIFCAAFCIGSGPLPWTSVAELFPSKLKGFASCLIGAYVWIISFIVVKSYENILETFGSMAVFMFFGVAELVCVTLLCYIQPNTKNLSFQEIQDLLSGAPPPVTPGESDKDSLG